MIFLICSFLASVQAPKKAAVHIWLPLRGHEQQAPFQAVASHANLFPSQVSGKEFQRREGHPRGLQSSTDHDQGQRAANLKGIFTKRTSRGAAGSISANVPAGGLFRPLDKCSVPFARRDTMLSSLAGHTSRVMGNA